MLKSGRAGSSVSKRQHSFSVAETGINRERSSIDRPSRTQTAIDANYLYPIYLDEVLPGDTFQVKMNMRGWLATPQRPFLDNLIVSSFFFFCPNRLVWENWQRFQGEKDNPDDSTTYTVPQMDIANGRAGGNLADYLGVPLNGLGKSVNAMPFRIYNKIFNDFFRDTNLQDSVVVDIDDSDSTQGDYVLLKRGRAKDYLTGALPWAQRGDVEPGVISGTVPVTAVVAAPIPKFTPTGESLSLSLNATSDLTRDAVWSGAQAGTGELAYEWETTALEANLDTAAANTINQLRQSIAIQQTLELDARTGTRYKELLKARWGVTSEDFRLQRPEYLGGGTLQINVNAVTTSSNASSGDIGAVGAVGQALGECGGFSHSFTEHGFIMGMISIRSDYTYFEGIDRMWSRETRYDYYEPSLAHLGEQPIYNREILSSTETPDGEVWGYGERYSEYKFGKSMCTGIMRPNHDDALLIWNLAEEFDTLPSLNAAFIVDNCPVDRVVAVTTEPHFIVDCHLANRTTRVMPVFNTPGLTRL